MISLETFLSPLPPQAVVLPRKNPRRFDDWDKLCFGAITAGLAAAAVFLLYMSSHPPLAELARHPQLGVFYRPSLLWAGFGLALLTARSLLWIVYRMPSICAYDDAPTLTVVIPAYNEGPMVANSVDSVANARYPTDRLEILVIDDGSRDDTWKHIEEAARRHPGLVTPIRFARNQGKRAALEAGFRRARGRVVVTVDSDSIVEPGALLAMAGPFHDPQVGAVGGKVSVLNHREGVIPRMLKVQYALAFDMIRAAQSTYGVVQCCPGALAAYRADALRRVLDDWGRQKFLGQPCTYGEDQALTNFILGLGYDSLYQRQAVVHTLAPTSYDQLCKMYLRWERSNIQEFFRFLPIAWRRPPAARAMALFDVIVSNMRYPIWILSLGLMVMLCVLEPVTALPRMLLLVGLGSSFNMLYYLRSERSKDFVYGILYSYFSFFSLFWISIYALITVRSRSWMTR